MEHTHNTSGVHFNPPPPQDFQALCLHNIYAWQQLLKFTAILVVVNL